MLLYHQAILQASCFSFEKPAPKSRAKIKIGMVLITTMNPLSSVSLEETLFFKGMTTPLSERPGDYK